MVSPGTHLVKNHESQSGAIEAVTESEDRHQNSLSQFTEIKI